MEDLLKEFDQWALASNPGQPNPDPNPVNPNPHYPNWYQEDNPPPPVSPSRRHSPPPMIRPTPVMPFLQPEPNTGEPLEVFRDLVEDLDERAMNALMMEENGGGERPVSPGPIRTLLEEVHEEMMEAHMPPSLRAPPPCPPSVVDWELDSDKANHNVLRRFVINLQRSASQQVVANVQERVGSPEFHNLAAAQGRKLRRDYAVRQTFIVNLHEAISDGDVEGLSWDGPDSFLVGSVSQLEKAMEEGYFGLVTDVGDFFQHLSDNGFQVVEGSANLYHHPSGMFQHGAHEEVYGGLSMAQQK